LRKKDVFRAAAEREAAWFFRDLGGKVPEGGDPVTRAAAAWIDDRLRGLPPFHRGVLALLHAPRSWPAFITKEFREVASVVVRLECALHPAVGISTEALENASIDRLRKEVLGCTRVGARQVPGGRERHATAGERRLKRLARRARRHVQLALIALARVRGEASCVVPAREAQ